MIYYSENQILYYFLGYGRTKDKVIPMYYERLENDEHEAMPTKQNYDYFTISFLVPALCFEQLLEFWSSP